MSFSTPRVRWGLWALALTLFLPVVVGAVPRVRPTPGQCTAPPPVLPGTLTALRTGAVTNWSNPATWPGGVVPGRDANVLIPAGQTVLLDVNTANLGGLRIEGTLRFDPTKDLGLTADWILVYGTQGRLEIGSAAAPYPRKATVTLTASDPNENVIGEGVMAMGTKFLGTMAGGSVFLHGHRRSAVSWTQLDGHVQPGATSLRLAVPVDWRVGDKIVLAPSGFDPFDAEELTITSRSADGRTIGFSPALVYFHFGEQQTIEGQVVDQRAEVGLLTRDIVVRGDDASLWEVLDYGEYGYRRGFGGHGMFMEGGTVQIEGVEFVNMGQTGKRGRYPVHWHFAGDRPNDFVRSSSFHKSFHRAVNIHRTNRMLVADNVAYDIVSHAYVWSEDGPEVYNRLERNLGVLVRRVRAEDFAFPDEVPEFSTQSEQRVGVFWGRNVHNDLRDNHAAGTYFGHGFMFDKRFMDNEFNRADWIARTNVFTGNLAHSNYTETGVNNDRYGPQAQGTGLFVQIQLSDGPQRVFSDFTSYKNSLAGAWLEQETETLRNARLTDNGLGVFVKKGIVEDLLIAGQTANREGQIPNIGLLEAPGGGINLRRQGLDDKRFDDNRLVARRVTFVDVQDYGITIEVEDMVAGSEVEGLRFVRTQPIFFYSDLYSAGRIFDKDGSLSGLGVQGYIHGPKDATSTSATCDWFGNWNGSWCPASPRTAPFRAPQTVAGAVAGLFYDYYAGEYLRLPDFPALVPTSTGTAAGFALSLIPDGKYAVAYNGFLQVPTTGIYTFSLRAKDGAQLFIGDQMLVNADRAGQPGPTWTGWMRLQAGLHPLRVTYFKYQREPYLDVSWSGPGIATQPIPNSRLFRAPSQGGTGTPNPVIAITPTTSTTVPASGGEVRFNLTITNTGTGNFSGDFWAELRNPAGVPNKRLAVPVTPVGLAPGQSQTTSHRVQMRGSYKAGTWTVVAFVGTHPSTKRSQASMPITKTSGGGSRTGGMITMDATQVPTDMALSAYPNPANPTTTLELALPEAGAYAVTLYDLLGRPVSETALTADSPSMAALTLDLRDQASGVYLVRVVHEASQRASTLRLTLLK